MPHLDYVHAGIGASTAQGARVAAVVIAVCATTTAAGAVHSDGLHCAEAAMSAVEVPPICRVHRQMGVRWPRAAVLLWQLAQLEVIPERLNRAPLQPLCGTDRNPGSSGRALPLPVALVPLWQLAQLPVIPAWSKRPNSMRSRCGTNCTPALSGYGSMACPPPGCRCDRSNKVGWSVNDRTSIVHCRVMWQESQLASVRTWLVGSPLARTELWHAEHSLGVPLNSPLRWQLSHETLAWAPVSGNPVAK